MSVTGRSLRRMTTIVFAPGDRPDVEVRVDGVWCPGELRMWQQRGGDWWAQVNYRSEPGTNRITTVHERDVRPDEHDYAGCDTALNRD